MAINLKTIAAAAALLTASCGSEVRVPDNATPTQEAADIFPEYRDIYIPQNIAPLNVQIKSDGDEFAACIKGEKGGEITAAADKDGKLMFDTEAWHALLNENAGKTLSVTLYSHRDGQWLEHPAYQLHVAEPIDEYLSYRLIEPSYELYRQMGLKDKLPQMSDDEVFALLATDGMLVKRPLVIDGERGVYLTGFREAQWEQTLL